MHEQPIKGRNGGTLLRRKKGDPGNPGVGRPKGSLNSATIISKWLKVKQTIDNPITGNQQSLSQFDIIVLKQITNAKDVDTRAFNALIDRLEGKASQAIELGNWTQMVRGINTLQSESYKTLL